MDSRRTATPLAMMCALLTGLGCSSEQVTTSEGDALANGPGAGSVANPPPSPPGATGGDGDNPTPIIPPPTMPQTPDPVVPAPVPPDAADGPDAGTTTGSPPAPPATPSAGPVDGDPNAPMVAIDGVPCGVPQVGFTSSPATVEIGGREVVVAYPCAREGAQVTLFLFIHGTLQDAQKVPFTMRSFPIHEFVDSDNLIVMVPKAVGTQWGNGDGGADLPHLYDVVDWAYDAFGDKFDIRSMWASGGSWGAFYLSRTFACDPRFEGRLRGVRMVVGTPCPACSDRLACIVAEQELEEGGGMPLSAAEQETKSDSNIGQYAAQHGCDAKMKMPDLGPIRHWTWPNCDDGWVHSYYLGPGEHADTWDYPESMRYMVDEIKSIE